MVGSCDLCNFCLDGDIAQLVERLHGMQEVRGSTPLVSTFRIIPIIGGARKQTPAAWLGFVHFLPHRLLGSRTDFRVAVRLWNCEPGMGRCAQGVDWRMALA